MDEAPDARRVWDRVWLWPDWPSPERERKAISYAESPLYGKVYARFVAKGRGLEEFRAHSLSRRIGEAKAKEANRALAGGSPKAKPLEEKVEALGFGHLLEEHRTKAQLDASTYYNLLYESRGAYAPPPGESLQVRTVFHLAF